MRWRVEKPRPLDVAVFAGSALAAAGRFLVPGHGLSWPGTYEAFAHLWCGFLLGVIVFRKDHRWSALVVLAAITALETVMFFLR